MYTKLRLAAALCCLLLGDLVLAGEAKPADFPKEIRLSSGGVLRNTSPVRWTSDGVVIKHAGGADPVRFEHIAEPDRSAVVLARPGATQAAKIAPTNTALVKVSGQVFVTTRGAGAYKFSGVEVTVFPLTDLDAFKSIRQVRRSSVPSLANEYSAWQAAFEGRVPVAKARTDADGKYSIDRLEGKAVFVACHARRLVAGREEHFYWLLPVTSSDLNLDLSNCETAP